MLTYGEITLKLGQRCARAFRLEAVGYLDALLKTPHRGLQVDIELCTIGCGDYKISFKVKPIKFGREEKDMHKEVDWSKAPVGATHYSYHEDIVNPWLKAGGGYLYFWEEVGYYWKGYICTQTANTHLAYSIPKPIGESEGGNAEQNPSPSYGFITLGEDKAGNKTVGLLHEKGKSLLNISLISGGLLVITYSDGEGEPEEFYIEECDMTNLALEHVGLSKI